MSKENQSVNHDFKGINSLNTLNYRKLGDFKLVLENIKKGRFKGEYLFELYLTYEDFKPLSFSSTPVIRGRFFRGEGYYRPWLEVYFYKRAEVKIDSEIVEVNLAGGLDEVLFGCLSDVLPPASHLMVFYGDDEETQRELTRGVPPPVSYLGFLMFKAGFTWFKDWYFPEGYLEGGVKLQGNKPMNDKHKKKNLIEIKTEIESFLGRVDDSCDPDLKKALIRARYVLEYIKKMIM